MAVVSTYIDIFAFLRATTGLETASLIGNYGRLSSAVSIGASTLPVTPGMQVSVKPHDQVTIFDGLNSEVLPISTYTSGGASSIPLLTPTTKVHAQYTTYCTDGGSGSLADEIVNASGWIDNVCEQSLFQQTYTDETLDIPSMSASIDNRGMLVFAPRHYPISATSGITIKSSASSAIDYDQAQIILDASKQVISVPWLKQTSSGSGSVWSSAPPYSRQENLFLLVDYTAGYSPVPPDIRDATVLRTAVILGRRQNSTGAVRVSMGKRRLEWDTGSKAVNQHMEDAKEMLAQYMRKV